MSKIKIGDVVIPEKRRNGLIYHGDINTSHLVLINKQLNSSLISISLTYKTSIVRLNFDIVFVDGDAFKHYDQN